MSKRKIVLASVLLLALVVTLVLPALATTNDLIPAAPSTQITRDQYNNFGGVRHTANNSTRAIADGVTFVADNRNLNLWYIHVTANVEGTIQVAYQISNRHFARTVNIFGPGRYIIGDSRGSNGLNEIRLGGFVGAPVCTGPDYVPVRVTWCADENHPFLITPHNIRAKVYVDSDPQPRIIERCEDNDGYILVPVGAQVTVMPLLPVLYGTNGLPAFRVMESYSVEGLRIFAYLNSRNNPFGVEMGYLVVYAGIYTPITRTATEDGLRVHYVFEQMAWQETRFTVGCPVTGVGHGYQWGGRLITRGEVPLYGTWFWQHDLLTTLFVLPVQDVWWWNGAHERMLELVAPLQAQVQEYNYYADEYAFVDASAPYVWYDYTAYEYVYSPGWYDEAPSQYVYVPYYWYY